MARRLLSVSLIMLSLLLAARLPFCAVGISLVSLIVLFTCARYPVAWLWLILPAIGAMDLSPWTGRSFANEWDSVMLALLAGACWSNGFTVSTKTSRRDVCLAPFVLSLAIMMLPGLTNLEWMCGAERGVYALPANAVRIGRAIPYFAMVWLLLPSESSGRACIAMAKGAVVGLLCTTAIVFWERLSFSGLWNVQSEFRVVGPFAEMHVGGAGLDLYLAACFPLLLLAYQDSRRVGLHIAIVAATAGAFYSAVATLSRSTIVVIAMQFVVILTVWACAKRDVDFKKGKFIGVNLRRSVTTFPWRLMAALIISVTSVSAAASLPSVRARMANWAPDLEIRLRQYHEVWSATRSSIEKMAFGSGIGAMPSILASYSHHAVDSYSSTTVACQSSEHESERALRVNARRGRLYFGQFASVRRDVPYRCEVVARRKSSAGSLVVGLCEKNLLSSFDCVYSGPLFDNTPQSEWSEQTVNLMLGAAPASAAGGLHTLRPIQFTFFVSDDAQIEIASIKLFDERDRDILKNGGFEKGMDHWWWTCDEHLSYHAKNLYLHVLAEQGILGLAAFCLACGVALWRCLLGVWNFQTHAVALLLALGGMLLIGLFDSVIESPRILLLMLLLLTLAMRCSPEHSSQIALLKTSR